jgi:hypothetical protein
MCVSQMVENALPANNPQLYSLGSPWDEVSIDYMNSSLRI